MVGGTLILAAAAASSHVYGATRILSRSRCAPLIAQEPLSDAERAVALRLPTNPPPPEEPSDRGDPLWTEADDALMEQANFRVRRRAAAGVYNATTTSQSLPLVALLAQVAGGGGLCAALSYCYLLTSEAEAGTAWAVEALAHSDEWWFGLFGWLWGKPPGGPFCLIYAVLNGANAVRCAPLLFDRLVVGGLPNATVVDECER